MVDVIIVGAGIAGLTCAITLARYSGVYVTVLERAPAIIPAGNGMQVPGNACHVLRSMGLLDKLIAKAGGTAPGCLSVDYEDGRTLLRRDFSFHEKIYGAPWLLVHRADYIDVLLEEAYRLGVKIVLDCEVRQVNFDAPFLTLANNDVYSADVIIGCDGINSAIRKASHPKICPKLTATFAYRALFTPAQLATSPLLQPLSTSPFCRFWLGPSGHAVFYPLQGGSMYNLVIIIADGAFNDGFSSGTDIAQSVKAWMHGWDPVVRSLLDVADDLARFPLWHVDELPVWSRGCVTLMGDAAHPTFPYLGQGAAMAVEDAMVLGTLLGMFTHHTSAPAKRTRTRVPKAGIKMVLNAYEALQRRRTASIVSRSRENGYFNHLPRGADQRARDAIFAAFDTETTSSACPWIDASFNRALLGRDAEAVAVAEFDRLVAHRLLGRVPRDRFSALDGTKMRMQTGGHDRELQARRERKNDGKDNGRKGHEITWTRKRFLASN